MAVADNLVQFPRSPRPHKRFWWSVALAISLGLWVLMIGQAVRLVEADLPGLRVPQNIFYQMDALAHPFESRLS